jgi:hypothetical protein
MLGNLPYSGGIVVDVTIDALIGRHTAMSVFLKNSGDTKTSRPVVEKVVALQSCKAYGVLLLGHTASEKGVTSSL